MKKMSDVIIVVFVLHLLALALVLAAKNAKYAGEEWYVFINFSYDI